MTEYSKKNIWYPKPYTAYAHRTVTVSGSSVDYDASESGLFDKLEFAYEALIRNGSSAISVKFNSVDSDPVPIAANDNFGVSGYLISNIYVTASGGGDVEVYMMGWK
jgi:hypothetical protein